MTGGERRRWRGTQAATFLGVVQGVFAHGGCARRRRRLLTEVGGACALGGTGARVRRSWRSSRDRFAGDRARARATRLRKRDRFGRAASRKISRCRSLSSACVRANPPQADVGARRESRARRGRFEMWKSKFEGGVRDTSSTRGGARARRRYRAAACRWKFYQYRGHLVSLAVAREKYAPNARRVARRRPTSNRRG